MGARCARPQVPLELAATTALATSRPRPVQHDGGFPSFPGCRRLPMASRWFGLLGSTIINLRICILLNRQNLSANSQSLSLRGGDLRKRPRCERPPIAIPKIEQLRVYVSRSKGAGGRLAGGTAESAGNEFRNQDLVDCCRPDDASSADWRCGCDGWSSAFRTLRPASQPLA